jgi:hypothetical protein
MIRARVRRFFGKHRHQSRWDRGTLLAEYNILKIGMGWFVTDDPET